MPNVRRYPNVFLARQAAAYLHGHGIFAHVHDGGTPFDPASAWVVVDDPLVAAHAAETLRAMDREPIRLDRPLSEAWKPNLSRLPGYVRIPCPDCGTNLPHDASRTRCPNCGTVVDPVRILLDRDGPEALAMCYDSEPAISDQMLQSAPMFCTACGYQLRGLEVRGTCPECGTAYDKRTMVEGL